MPHRSLSPRRWPLLEPYLSLQEGRSAYRFRRDTAAIADYTRIPRDAARAGEAEAIGLSPSEAEDPGALPRWPTPGALAGKVKRKDTFTLDGERGDVFGAIYDRWYANLSMVAHQRLPGIEKSAIASEPSSEERKRLASDILTSACFFVLCILTEITSTAGLPTPAKLQEAWVYVKDRSQEMHIAYDTRYQRLLVEGRELS